MQSYPMGYPIFIKCLSNRISMFIPSLSNGISNNYPTHPPSISNWLSKPIQQDIQTYPNGYPIGYPIGYLIWTAALESWRVPALSSLSAFWHHVLHRLWLQMGCHRALNERGASVTRVHVPLLHSARPLCCRCCCCAAATNAAQQPPASGAPGMCL